MRMQLKKDLRTGRWVIDVLRLQNQVTAAHFQEETPPLATLLTVEKAGFIDAEPIHFDPGEVSASDAGLLGEQKMVVAEVKGLGSPSGARIVIAHDGGGDGVR